MKIRNLIQKEFKIANQPPPKDKADYKAKMSTIQDLQKNPKLRDPESQANIMKRKAELKTWAKKNLKNVVIQGGLNPNILLRSEKEIIQGATLYIKKFRDIPYIFNLGHGLLPETDPDKVDKLVKFYRNFNE